MSSGRALSGAGEAQKDTHGNNHSHYPGQRNMHQAESEETMRLQQTIAGGI